MKKHIKLIILIAVLVILAAIGATQTLGSVSDAYNKADKIISK